MGWKGSSRDGGGGWEKQGGRDRLSTKGEEKPHRDPFRIVIPNAAFKISAACIGQHLLKVLKGNSRMLHLSPSGVEKRQSNAGTSESRGSHLPLTASVTEVWRVGQ